MAATLPEKNKLSQGIIGTAGAIVLYELNHARKYLPDGYEIIESAELADLRAVEQAVKAVDWDCVIGQMKKAGMPYIELISALKAAVEEKCIHINK